MVHCMLLRLPRARVWPEERAGSCPLLRVTLPCFVFWLFGQTFCIPWACLGQAGSAAENCSPCDSYLPEKAGRGKQVVLFMLKMPGMLQATFQLLCFETLASHWAKGGSSSLGCSPFPSPWKCTHFLPFQIKPPCFHSLCCVPAGFWGFWLCWWGCSAAAQGYPMLPKISSSAEGSCCCGDWGTGRETLGRHYRLTCHCLRLFAPQKANLFW